MPELSVLGLSSLTVEASLPRHRKLPGNSPAWRSRYHFSHASSLGKAACTHTMSRHTFRAQSLAMTAHNQGCHALHSHNQHIQVLDYEAFSARQKRARR